MLGNPPPSRSGVGKAQNGSAVVSTVSGIGIYPFSRGSTTLRMLARMRRWC